MKMRPQQALAAICLTSPLLAQQFETLETIDTFAACRTEVIALDFDLDGDMDIATSGIGAPSVSLHENLGAGTFAQRVEISDEDQCWAIETGDLNGDGLPDIFAVGQNRVWSILNGGGGIWQEVLGPPTAATRGCSLYDVDLDGDLDALVAVWAANDFIWLPNDGSGSFGPEITIWDGVGAGPHAVKAGDFDSDGWPDLLTGTGGGPPHAAVHWGSGSGTFDAPVDLGPSRYGNPYGFAVADMNGDGWLDLVVSDISEDLVDYHANTGQGSFSSPVTIADNEHYFNIQTIDIDNDQAIDVVATAVTGTTWLIKGIGDGTFESKVPLPGTSDHLTEGLICADFSGNGLPDVVVVDCAGNASSLDWFESIGPLDCDDDGIPDEDEIAAGSSDCNGNSIPDECDIANGYDCNGNGIPDSCDIASGFALDCNNNGIPDDCDIANDPTIDANLNSVPDSCEVAGSRYWILSPVTGNWYAVTDELDVTQAQLTALNWGGHLVTIGDQAENDWLAATFGDASTPIWTGFNDASIEGSFEWVSGAVPGFTAWDTATGQPDDAPGVFGGADFAVLEPVSGLWYDEPSDATSFAPGLPRGVVELVSSDCDNNGIPDTYELIQDPTLDCDGNGIHDLCDLLDPALDCDGDGVLDSCQIAADPSLDCDGNGAIDSCEILADNTLDCDADQTLDVCQIMADPSLDWNGDGLIDTCAGGGFVYCDSNVNAAGLNASIVPEGSPLVGDDAFCIRAYDLPAGTPGVPGMFIMSRSTGYLNPFGGGAGVLCLGAPIRRFGPNDGFPLQFSGTAGEITLCPPIASFPGPSPVQPGEVIHFQMWFREVDLTTGLPTSNTTDGISVMFR